MPDKPCLGIDLDLAANLRTPGTMLLSIEEWNAKLGFRQPDDRWQS